MATGHFVYHFYHKGILEQVLKSAPYIFTWPISLIMEVREIIRNRG